MHREQTYKFLKYIVLMAIVYLALKFICKDTMKDLDMLIITLIVGVGLGLLDNLQNILPSIGGNSQQQVKCGREGFQENMAAASSNWNIKGDGANDKILAELSEHYAYAVDASANYDKLPSNLQNEQLKKTLSSWKHSLGKFKDPSMTEWNLTGVNDKGENDDTYTKKIKWLGDKILEELKILMGEKQYSSWETRANENIDKQNSDTGKHWVKLKWGSNKLVGIIKAKVETEQAKASSSSPSTDTSVVASDASGVGSTVASSAPSSDASPSAISASSVDSDVGSVSSGPPQLIEITKPGEGTKTLFFNSTTKQYELFPVTTVEGVAGKLTDLNKNNPNREIIVEVITDKGKVNFFYDTTTQHYQTFKTDDIKSIEEQLSTMAQNNHNPAEEVTMNTPMGMKVFVWNATEKKYKLDESKTVAMSGHSGAVAANSFTKNDFNRLPITTLEYEQGYSFMPPKDWYPVPANPPVCVTDKKCPVCPVYTDGHMVDLKTWNNSSRIA